MKKLSHQEILELRKNNSELECLPVCLLLDNIRSSYNVGSLFRLADGAGLEKIILAGITSTPDNPKVGKTALGAEKTVPWEYHVDASRALESLTRSGYHIVVLEHIEESQVYWDVEYPYPLCLVVGNEVNGVDERLMKYADRAIEIPMRGEKNSLNVSTATSIIVYELLRQWGGRG